MPIPPSSQRFCSPKTFSIAAILIIGILCSATALLCMVPPISRDALTHHLAVPKLYIEAGGMIELPCMGYSYYPMNLDLLYWAALYFGSDIAPKFIHFAFSLLTAWLIHWHLKKRIDRHYALAGAILFFSIPIIIKLSITVYVDLGLLFFSTAALLMLLEWIVSGFRIKYLIISSIACGLAMGTKPNGLVTFFLITLFVPFIYSRQNKKTENSQIKSVGWAFLFVTVALIVFSPWMIRNYHWTKNPIYPLYNGVFKGKPATPCPVSKYAAGTGGGKISMFTRRAYLYGESNWEMALLPLRIFFQGKDNDFKHFDGRLSPLLLILPIVAFVPLTGSRRTATVSSSPFSINAQTIEKKALLAFAMLFFLFAFFSTVLRIRYFLPSIPPLVIISIHGLKNGIDFIQNANDKGTAKTIQQKIVALLLGIGALYFLFSTTQYFMEKYERITPLKYITGQISREDYITRFRPEYPAFQYINQHLPADATILFFYLGKRGYYCDRDYIPFAGNSVKMLHNFITAIPPKESVESFFKTAGITHFLINNRLFVEGLSNNISEEEAKAIGIFMNRYMEKIFEQNGFSIYKPRIAG